MLIALNCHTITAIHRLSFTLFLCVAVFIFEKHNYYMLPRQYNREKGANMRTKNISNNQLVEYDQNEYLPISKISRLIGISAPKIRQEIANGHIDAEKIGVTKIRVSEALRYHRQKQEEKLNGKNLDFDITEAFKFLPSFPRTNRVINPQKYRGKTVYAIGCNGTIINTNRMCRVEPYITGNGHLQVKLFDRIQPAVQQLVAMMWCNNAKCKNIVHHIDGEKQNNNYKNLLCVDAEEHGKLHSLMDAIKSYQKNGDVEKEMITKKAYFDLVNSIEADNSESIEDLRIIPHLDFSSDGKVKYYHYVTEESYQKYLITRNEGDLVIKGEGAF